MHVIAEIAWNPEIRNILALLVGVIVLFGSITLIVGSNAGPRTGTLVVLAALFGWMATMGAIWWMYGIGMKGEESHWRVTEINYGDLSQADNAKARGLKTPDEAVLVKQMLADHPDLAPVANPTKDSKHVYTVSELVDAGSQLKPPADLKTQYHLNASDLAGWRILVPSDKQRGDAQAVADAALIANKVFGSSTTSASYKVIDAYDTGGKRPLPSSVHDCHPWDPSTFGDCKERVWDNIYTSVVQVTHPEHFALVQVRQVVPQETVPGQAPPTPEFDQTKPVVSVAMIRSLGDKRFPAFMITLIFGILFAVTCNALHRRDKLQAAHLAAA